MAEKEEEIKITVICWKCDQKFAFTTGAITAHQAVYFDDRGVELGRSLIRPKTYLVPCPNPDCGAENEVTLP
jgi:hypothetical protein